MLLTRCRASDRDDLGQIGKLDRKQANRPDRSIRLWGKSSQFPTLIYNKRSMARSHSGFNSLKF